MTHRLLAILLLLAATAALAVAPVADAHAKVAPSSGPPAYGERLAEAPKEVVVVFSEPVDPSATQLVLINETKVEIALGPLRLTDDGIIARATIEDALPPGAYVVKWKTLSTYDGHPTFGSIPFGVQQDADLSAGLSGTQGLRFDMVVGKALIFAGLSLVAGAFAFWYLVLPRGHRKGHEERVERVGHIGAWAHLAGLLLFAFGDAAIKDMGIGQLLTDTAFGRGLMLRFGLALLLVAGFHVSVRRADVPRFLWAGMAVVAGITFVVHGRYSHAPGFITPGWLGILVDAVHFASIGIWVGGLIAFAAWLYGLPQDRDDVAREFAVVPKRFSDLATWSIVLVSLTGIALMWALLGFSLSSYTHGLYGRLLGLKILLAVAMMVLGGLNKWLFVRRYQRGGGFGTLRAFRDNVHRELGIAVIVFLLAGAATNLSPPTPPAPGPDDIVVGEDLNADPGLLTERIRTENYAWEVNFHPPPALNEPTHHFLVIRDNEAGEKVPHRP